MKEFSPLTALGRLKLLAWIEGISYLVLLFITMPLKYFGGVPAPNMMAGKIHGVLFLLYVFFLVMATAEYSWKRSVFIKGFLASLFPFATFWADRKLFVNE